jgi:hypothetical protein
MPDHIGAPVAPNGGLAGKPSIRHPVGGEGSGKLGCLPESLAPQRDGARVTHIATWIGCVDSAGAIGYQLSPIGYLWA